MHSSRSSARSSTPPARTACARWLWLGDAGNLPPPAAQPSEQERLLARIADGVQGHPALGAYKGIDEPRNPFRGANWIRPAGMIRAYTRLKQIDPVHPRRRHAGADRRPCRS